MSEEKPETHLELDPEIELALEEQRTGKLSAASERCKKILEQDPAHDEALHLLGVIAYQQQNYSEALVLFRQAIDIEGKAHYYNNMGNLYSDLGQFKLAQKMYQAALRLQPDFTAIRMNLGKVFLQLNQAEDAIFQFQAVLRKDPEKVEALTQLGHLFLVMKRYVQAQEFFKQVLSIQPQAEAFNNLGVIESQLGHPEEALEYYQEAVKLKPKSTDYLYNLANALKKQNKPTEALPFLEQILELDPNHEAACYQLGAYFLEEKRYARATQLFHRVLEINPERSDAHVFLGGMAFMAGNLEQALEHFLKRAESHSEDHKTLYNLGVIYEKLGQLDASSRHMNQALVVQMSK